MTLPPGPKSPAFLTTYRWLAHPFEFQEDCALELGDAFTIHLPGLPNIVVFSNPDVVKTIFAEPGDALHAGEFNRSLEAFLGDKSVLMVDGKAHTRKRRLLMPPFHGERMLGYGRVMQELADDAIDDLPIGKPFSFHEPMNRIALDVIVRNVFGFEPGPREAAVRKNLSELLAIMTWPPLLIPQMRVDLGPLSPWGRATRKRREADALLFDEIRTRRTADNSGRGDILSLLLAARDEDGNAMSDDELRDELVTLLVAGHETTATALSWAIRWILADASAEAMLRRELDSAGELTPQRVQGLPLLDGAAREALRLCPVVPIVGRVLTRDMQLGGWDLPKGTAVVCSMYLAHRRPEAFPDPTRFNPARYLEKKAAPYELYPFGGGIRRCIGMAFAMFEMKMVLAQVLRRTRMVLDSKDPIRPTRRAITLVPSGGPRVRVLEKLPRTAGGAFAAA